MLTTEELKRYDRQLLIRGMGPEGQERLKRAKVAIAGMGGLGCTVAVLLAEAGIGTMALIDDDEVQLPNLNRQALYWTTDIGRRKVFAAAEKLKSLNPHTEVIALSSRISATTAEDLISGYDGVVDALDKLESRLHLNKAAMARRIPVFHAAVRAFDGRVITIVPGTTACLKCVTRGSLPEERVPVIGTTAAVIGSIQATEVIKYFTGIGRLLLNRFAVYDGRQMTFTELRVSRNPCCPHCGLIKGQALE